MPGEAPSTSSLTDADAQPAHVHAVKARGREYYFYQPNRGARVKGRRTRLPGMPFAVDGTPDEEWWAAYRAAAGSTGESPGPATFSALIAAYTASPEWKDIGERTRVEWLRDLGRIERAWGTLSVKGLEPKDVYKLRDQRAATPAAANNLIKALSAMISWSIPRSWRTTNPCAHIKKLKIGEGYAPWDWSDIEHFQLNGRKDLWHAAALALFTGQRQSDVLKMRWDELQDGLISVVQNKTGKKLWIPVHAQLRAVLAEIPRKAVTIIASTQGRPWTVSGFKGSWTDELNRPLMKVLREKKRVFHGLGKSAVVFLLEAGCIDAEVCAITGQSRQMVEHYARQVNQKKLAASAVLKWEGSTRGGDDNGPE